VKQLTLAIFLSLVCDPVVFGQNGPRETPPWVTQDDITRLERQALLLEMETRNAALVRQMVERQVAEQQRREFAAKANRFITIWNKLIGEYSRQGTFNVKQARALSKAFHDLESISWPK
jgi:hypothetical protein